MRHTFEYTLVQPSGSTVKGRIEAPDEQAVAARLRELGLTPTRITVVSGSVLHRSITLGERRPRPKDVAIALRQLATMVNAGLSLPRALAVLRTQTAGQALESTIQSVEQDVRDGETLSRALERHPRVFSPVTLAMVRSGETGGYLDDVLAAVATIMEKEIALRRTVRTAMVYPAVVLAMALLAVAAMLLFIVPVFQEMFDGLGAELPWATQMLVGASQVFRVAIGPLALALCLCAWWWRRHRTDADVRARLDPVKLRTPIFGPLLRKVALSRFSGNLATMVRVGVPVVPALATVGATSGNVVIERAVERVREAVHDGATLGDAIATEAVFPAMLRQMVAVGEDSGSLDTMLAKVADFYDQEVEAATASLTSVLEPLLILVVGVIVGAMLLGLYMPIFSISDAVN
ncbi:type II secretion system F family protein [Xylanimonas ulmi]|uniref:Type IV pilus assembly protein PilC n=1 Tax=Xylanimonas ulmi TaxID=228973 RepID=A0A4Q7M2L7_9MICO|nr:type II secretion system F family protein [Xylanibacterium ulmi]RZS61521.1 type IV pilus assembly protein PilC [Xylanibacterium ulmi]